ncbi:MAG: glycosyltransferase [Syntrophomonas sp.]
MIKPKILIFSASFGAGHIRAAQALSEAIILQNPSAQIVHMDFGAMLNKYFYILLKDFYISMLKHTPRVWGSFYYSTSRISQRSVVQRFLNSMGQTEYLKYINAVQPDVIVCTYPTVAGVLAKLRLKKLLDIPVVTVVTDYTVHSQWIHDGVDLYIVGCQEVSAGLSARGINPQQIKTTGIPVSPRFESELNRPEIIARLGISGALPTIMVMGGAYGVLSELKRIVAWLAASSQPVQAIVVCGRDQKLYNSLDEILQNPQNPVIRFGYVNNVDELMSIADLVITKAGGLITTESLNKRLPLLVFKPIPGQEEENAKYVSRIGAGCTAKSLPELFEIVADLLANPEQLSYMRQAASNSTPGGSATNAAQHILNQIAAIKQK